MNHIGEQHPHLLVLRRSADLRDRRSAFVAELKSSIAVRCRTTGTTIALVHRPATVPHAAPGSIVSPPVSDVGHIAVQSRRRSFETVVCGLFCDVPVGSGSPRTVTAPPAAFWIVTIARVTC